MSLDAFDLSPGRPFAARLTHPDLARLFMYWSRLARDGVPAYRTFDPIAVAFSLPHLQLYRRVVGGDCASEYRLDLVGESAAQLIGANNRGKLLSEVLKPQRLPERLALFDQTLATGLPIAYRSFLANPGREHRLQKRLLLPFAESAAGPDLLIAMVVGFHIEPDQVPLPGRSEGILETIAASRSDIEAAAAEHRHGRRGGAMDAFLVSTGVVALGEIGDKTQLLAVLLAARFRKPIPVILGILAATLLNHALAGYIGTLVADFLAGPWLGWIVGGTFLAVAAWALVPDTIEDSDANRTLGAAGAFLATAVAFFFAEFGDKTQVATVTLAARFGDLLPVVAGTTLGMLLADVPAVYLGERFAGRLPVATIRYAAAALFAVLGIATLAGFGF